MNARAEVERERMSMVKYETSVDMAALPKREELV